MCLNETYTQVRAGKYAIPVQNVLKKADALLP
jgi:hypothetical protein